MQKSKFFPILPYTYSSLKQVQPSTSHQIPQSPQQNVTPFPKQTLQFLSKSNIISTITSIVSTQLVTKFIRMMILQAGQQKQVHEQREEQQEEGVRVYGKMFTSYTERGDSFHWVYFQGLSDGDRKYIDLIASVSCTLIYELTDIETDMKYLQQYTENHKKITGRNPLLYCISTLSTSKCLPPTLSIPYQHITLPEEWPTLETETLQYMFQTGRKIISESYLLQNNKGVSISCAVLPHYFIKWQNMFNEQNENQQKIQDLSVIWNEAVLMLNTDVKEKCVSEYRIRMSKLYEDKKFVSIKLLKNSHQISTQIALKSVQKYRINNESIVEELQSLINQELNKILDHIMEINFIWGKNFIQSQFVQMQNRIKTKEFKLLSSLKQQFAMFIDYFQKKAQPLSCKKLQYYFQQFVVEKAFDFSTHIVQSDKRNVHLELTSNKSKFQQKQTQIKQLKRQITKQSSQSSKKIESLHQQMTLMKNRSQLLESTISQLKAERQLIQNESDKKISNLQKQFLQQINQHRQIRANLAQELINAKRRIAQLQSEIEKQKQMHNQSCEHYKLLIENLKYKQEQLKGEIEQITMRASQQLETIKRDSQRSLNKSSISRNQKEREGVKLIEQLNQIKTKYEELKKNYSNLEYEMQLKKAEQQVQSNDIQIALKLAEQRILEYQSHELRYKKLQQQLKTSQIEQQKLQYIQNQSQKQNALLCQQNSFLREQLLQLSQKYSTEKQNCTQLKTMLQELQQKLMKMETVKVNEWVQTQAQQQDGKIKGILEEAYQIVGVLEKQYEKVKIQNRKLRYRIGEF